MALNRMRPIPDVALVTGRSYRTIQAWARQNRLPHERRNGRVLVDLVAAAALSEQTSRRNRHTAN